MPVFQSNAFLHMFAGVEGELSEFGFQQMFRNSKNPNFSFVVRALTKSLSAQIYGPGRELPANPLLRPILRNAPNLVPCGIGTYEAMVHECSTLRSYQNFEMVVRKWVSLLSEYWLKNLEKMCKYLCTNDVQASSPVFS